MGAFGFVRPVPGDDALDDIDPLGLRIATAAGLTRGAKTKHLNAKVQPALFDAAASRVGSTSQTVVIEAALAALATQDDLGPWLAQQWGVLADIDPELIDQIAP